MSVDYFRCEFCGVQLMHPDPNRSQFPVTRMYKNQSREEGLLAVRCAECSDFPYQLEEGKPYRIDLIGRDDVIINNQINSNYTYFPHGLGHILEVYIGRPSEQFLSILRNDPIEMGFLVYEDANLIVIAYRLSDSDGWNITPYCWYAYKEWLRRNPPESPASVDDRKFTVAFVDVHGGKYRAIRQGIMTPEFAADFHKAIREQIDRGIPDGEIYRQCLADIPSLLMEDDLRSKLVTCFTL